MALSTCALPPSHSLVQMTCMKAFELPCNASGRVCLDRKGALWPDTYLNPDTGRPYHCFDCTVACADGSGGGGGNGTDDSGGGGKKRFCNNDLMAITMWMTGVTVRVGVGMCGRT